MSRLWVALPLLVLAGMALIIAQRPAYTAPLNGSGLPGEADFCQFTWPEFNNSIPMAGGSQLATYGKIFEQGVTDVLSGGDGGAIGMDAGFGPMGTDPRNEVGWQWYSGTFFAKTGNDWEFESLVTLPSPSTTTTYALAVRFYTDSTGTDHTYCDLNGAGSNLGADSFDPADLRLWTVEGTGAVGDSEGAVTWSVDVLDSPGACILLSTNSIDYGDLGFSTPSQPSSGQAHVTIESCSETVDIDLLARGTDATGPTAEWSLTSLPPGATNMCSTENDGIDEFANYLGLFIGGDYGIFFLSLNNQIGLQDVPPGGSVLAELNLLMPCTGSSGTGETVNSTVTFTAIPHATTAFDLDGDGFFLPDDCDDTNAAVYPGAPEIDGDGIDNNCDGVADPFSTMDADGDGFAANVDCNDNNAAINPNADEIIGDRIDNDCNGLADETF